MGTVQGTGPSGMEGRTPGKQAQPSLWVRRDRLSGGQTQPGERACQGRMPWTSSRGRNAKGDGRGHRRARGDAGFFRKPVRTKRTVDDEGPNGSKVGNSCSKVSAVCPPSCNMRAEVRFHGFIVFVNSLENLQTLFAPMTRNRYGASAIYSDSEEIRYGDEHDTNRDEERRVGHEIRKAHQRHTAYQRDDCPLPSSVDEEPQPHRAEQQTPKKLRLVQSNLTLARLLGKQENGNALRPA